MLKFLILKIRSADYFLQFVFGLFVIYLYVLDYTQDILLQLILINSIASFVLLIVLRQLASNKANFLIWYGFSRILFGYIILWEIAQRDYIYIYIWAFSTVYFLLMIGFAITYFVLFYKTV